jgi:hypothetical protein
MSYSSCGGTWRSAIEDRLPVVFRSRRLPLKEDAMHPKFWLIGLILLCAASVPADAQRRVLLNGCVEQGNPQFCRLLKGYNVTGASPSLQVGQIVTMGGTITTDVSPCPGIVLTDITYTATAAMCQRHHGGHRH